MCHLLLGFSGYYLLNFSFKKKTGNTTCNRKKSYVLSDLNILSAFVILKFRYDSWVQLNSFYLTGDYRNDTLTHYVRKDFFLHMPFHKS